MASEEFVDLYEILQVSPNADSETIERVFRHLAKRYHPDHQSGDADRFDQLVKAFRVLNDVEQRSAYDIRYQQRVAARQQLVEDAKGSSFEEDRRLRARLLSLLYLQRRREPHQPGLGNMELAQLVGCPYTFLDFHLWYLRQKKWAELTDTGAISITAEGVDRVEEEQLPLRSDRLLTAQGSPSSDPDRNRGR